MLGERQTIQRLLDAVQLWVVVRGCAMLDMLEVEEHLVRVVVVWTEPQREKPLCDK